MALNETLQDNQVSSTYNPIATLTDCMISGSGKGQVFLEAQIPGGDWLVIASQVGAFNINTPDQAIGYRFRCSKVLEPVNVYLGP